MSSNSEASGSTPQEQQKKYRGVRCRKWGKWVSEIRVPGTKDRLWLGSYSSSEAAAVAHDVAYYCLRASPPSFSWDDFNFPNMLRSTIPSLQTDMSPELIQKAASDAGMAIDAQLALAKNQNSALHGQGTEIWEGVADRSWQGFESAGDALSISVEDYYF